MLVKLAKENPHKLAEYMIEKCGERQVFATSVPPAANGKMGFSVDTWADWDREVMPRSMLLAKLLKESEQPTGKTLYMQAAPIHTTLPELGPYTDLGFFNAKSMHSQSTQIWMGSGGQHLAIHQDATHSIICMLSGEKEFFLFPPNEHVNLYTSPQPKLFEYPWRSVVDPESPDLARYPAFAKALTRMEKVRIGPGDVFFLPAGWWHSVHSYGFNVMVNTRWLDVDAPSFDDASASFAHVVLTARHLCTSKCIEFSRSVRAALSQIGEPLTREKRLSARAALDRSPLLEQRKGSFAEETKVALAKGIKAIFATNNILLVNEKTGNMATLPFDRMALLRELCEPRTVKEIHASLSEDYEVDLSVVHDDLQALVAGDVLVICHTPTSEEELEQLAEGAVAHLSLSLAEIPLHHRDAISRWIEIFAFGSAGDPCSTIPVADQGMLSLNPTAQVLSDLEEIVRKALHTKWSTRRITMEDEVWNTHYLLHRGHHWQIKTDGLSFIDNNSKKKHDLPWEHLEILAHFSEPRRIQDVYDLVCASADFTLDDFREMALSWIKRRVLVTAGNCQER